MKPLMLMRHKGLTGPMFARHAGVPKLSKAGAVAGSLPVRPLRGWTGTENCAVSSDILVIVVFSGEVIYTNHTGVSITHDNGGVFTISGSATTPSPASTIQYDGTWNTPPSSGDVVSYQYSGGNYEDGEGEPMSGVGIQLTNCEGGAALAMEGASVTQEESGA